MSEMSERFTKPPSDESEMSEPPEEHIIRKLNIDKLKNLARQYNISGVSRYPASRKGEIIDMILEKRRLRPTDVVHTPTERIRKRVVKTLPNDETFTSESAESDTSWLVLGLVAVGSLGVILTSQKIMNKINGSER